MPHSRLSGAGRRRYTFEQTNDTPVSRSDAIIAQTTAVSAPNYSPLPIVAERAEGVWLWDVDGRKYLDCISAYSSLNQGHRHPRIMAALVAQAGRLTLTSRAVHNDQMGPFLAELCAVAGTEMALPMNTGAEAVETAIKLARKWGYRVKGVPHDRAEIVVCRNNFHGRTTTIVGFSSEAQYREDFGPYSAGFRLVDFGDLDALRAALTPNTAAFLVEPIQAEAGIIVPPPGYLAAARALCRERGVLFMLDEIQTGLGRTGKMFAHEHEAGAAPDVLVLGKALGGGVYPVSAVLASRALLTLFRPGDHGSTFGGNPLAAAVGRASVAVLVEEALPARAAELGDYLLEGLRDLEAPRVTAVRGRGLLIGIEIASGAGSARRFCEQLARRGVLAKDTHAQVIRLAPPLVVTRAELDWLVEQLAAVLR
jgi:ornithine--oxo-acid transaminase